MITKNTETFNLFGFEFDRVTNYGSVKNPFFVAKYVAEQLGYTNTRDAVCEYVDESDKRYWNICDNRSSKVRKMAIINEAGVYSLILNSDMPKAKVFQKMVIKEMLPSIINEGSFSIKSKSLF